MSTQCVVLLAKERTKKETHNTNTKPNWEEGGGSGRDLNRVVGKPDLSTACRTFGIGRRGGETFELALHATPQLRSAALAGNRLRQTGCAVVNA